jgi:hypothetical protein
VSFALYRPAWALDLPPPAKLVLLAIVEHANDDGRCWPSVATLCRRTGLSERTVRREIHSLCNVRGLLTVDRHDGRANRFTVMLDPCQTGTPATVAPLPEGHPHPCQAGTPTPATVAPRTYQLNQPENPSPSLPRSGKPKTTPTEPEGFAEVWKAYPPRNGRKVDRAKALTEYRREVKSPEAHADLLRAVAAYAEGCNGYPKDAHRWLKGGTWREWLTAAEVEVVADTRRRLN